MSKLLKYLLVLLIALLCNDGFVAMAKSNGLFGGTNKISKAASAEASATITSTNFENIIYAGQQGFRSNGNTITDLRIKIATSSNCGKYSIDWGDGSPSFNSNGLESTNHVYSVSSKFYTLKLTAYHDITGVASVPKTYFVYAGKAPSLGLYNPGTIEFCTTDYVKIALLELKDNLDETEYKISFNDGSDTLKFNQTEIINANTKLFNSNKDTILFVKEGAVYKVKIAHQLTKSSCGANADDYFTGFITAEHRGGSTPLTIPQLFVTKKPEAEISAPDVVCNNTPITISYPKKDGKQATVTGCKDPNIVWKITPDTGTEFILDRKLLGNDHGLLDQSQWTTGEVSLPITFVKPGKYTISMQVGNKCGSDMITKTIQVEESLTPSFTVDQVTACYPVNVNTTNTTVLTNNSGIPPYKWTVEYTKTFGGTAEDWKYTNGTNSESANPSFQFNAPGVYSIRLTILNSCGKVTSTPRQINVIKKPTATLNSISDGCGSASIKPTAMVDPCTLTTETLKHWWSFPGGTPSTSSDAIPGTIFYPEKGDYTIYYRVQNSCGWSDTVKTKFSVREIPVITNTVTSYPSLCAGILTDTVKFTSNLPTTTYSWEMLSVTGLQPGYIITGTTNFLPPQSFITSSNSVPGEIKYKITPLNGVCSGSPFFYTYKVNPAPYFIEQPTSVNVCQSSTGNQLKVTVNPNGAGTPSYQWYESVSKTSKVNLGAITGATSDTFAPPTNDLTEKHYYCVVTFPSASGACNVISSNIASFKVTTPPSIMAQPTPTQTLCLGSKVNELSVTFTGGAGVPSYQWFSNTTNANTGGVAISGATSSSYKPTGLIYNGDFYYYVVLTFAGSGCNEVRSEVAKITIVDGPSITSQPVANQKVCVNGTPAVLKIETNGSLGSLTFQWYKSNTANGSWIYIPVFENTYTPPTSTPGTTYYRCEISTEGGCKALSDTAKVTVVNQPVILSHPNSATVCEGDASPSMYMFCMNTIGIEKYQWYSSSTPSDLSSFTPVAGANTDTYYPSTLIPGTKTYFCVASYDGGSCSNLNSDMATITINPKAHIAQKDTTICSGATFSIDPAFTLGNVVPVGTKYTWRKPVISPANAISNATEALTSQDGFTQKLLNSTTNTALAVYTVCPTTGSCVGDSFKIIVRVNPSVDPGVTKTDITCFGKNNGSLATLVTGGKPFSTGLPYHVTWTYPDGTTSSQTTISNLKPGVYHLNIEDEGGCPISEKHTINEPAKLEIVTDSTQNITCHGASNGKIAVTIKGGTPPYTIKWYKNGEFYSNKEDLQDLNFGKYQLIVTDKNNCEPAISGIYEITDPTSLSIAFTKTINNQCFGDSIGLIDVKVTGGTPYDLFTDGFEYKYQWVGPNGFKSNLPNICHLKSGVYTLTATDKNGCPQTKSVEITQNEEIKVSWEKSNVTCYNYIDGAIYLTITGGVRKNTPDGYDIEWSNLGSGLSQMNIPAGDYVINITDSLGCRKQVKVTLPAPPIFTIDPVVKNVSCKGANDGSITLNFKGGVPPIKLKWSDGVTTGVTRGGLKPGRYHVTITNGNPCKIEKDFNIIEPDSISITPKLTPISGCNTPNSGAIHLYVIGGTKPYNYSWSNGSTDSCLVNIPAGTYSVVVTDANGCYQSGTYKLIPRMPVKATVSHYTIFDCSSKTSYEHFEAKATGGVLPYTFKWSGGKVSGSNNQIMEISGTGTVLLTVRDSSGCIDEYAQEIDVPQPGIEKFLIDCKTRSFKFNAQQPIKAGETATYLWDFGDGETSTEMNPEHTYKVAKLYMVTLKVTTPSCTKEYTTPVSVEPPPVITLDNALGNQVKLCKGDSLVVHAKGAHTYSWSDGTIGDSIVIRKEGDYYVVGRSIGGCETQFDFKATYYTDDLSYSIRSDKNEVSPSDPKIHLWAENIPFSEYYWDFGDGTTAQGNDQYHVFKVTKEGFYDVKLDAVNPQGCHSISQKRIWITNTCPINTFTPNGDGKNDRFMKDWHIKVYNRNGVLIYDGIDGWDGTYNGVLVSKGTYFYIMYYMSDGGSKTKEGFITLVR